MALRNIKIPTEAIVVNDDAFDVRGIALADLMVLAQAHGPALVTMFGMVMKKDGFEINESTVRSTILDVMTQFPDLLSALIALASDDYTPETVAIARRLPADAQASALQAIFRLSFSSEATLEKLLELATKMMGTLTQALNNATLPTFGGGIGDFGEARIS